MNDIDKLMYEEFARRFGQTDAPEASSLGNYTCCEKCRQRCECLASVDLADPGDAVYAFQHRMGLKAYEFIFPSIVRLALEDRDTGFEDLVDSLDPPSFCELLDSQRDATEFILDYCRSSEYGDHNEKDAISTALAHLVELREKG